MTQCPRCDVWIPEGHDHTQEECDEDIRQGRIIAQRDAVWQRKHAVEKPEEQLGFVMEVER